MEKIKDKLNMIITYILNIYVFFCIYIGGGVIIAFIFRYLFNTKYSESTGYGEILSVILGITYLFKVVLPKNDEMNDLKSQLKILKDKNDRK